LSGVRAGLASKVSQAASASCYHTILEFALLVSVRSALEECVDFCGFGVPQGAA
jgi:hypothetical protein